MSSPCNRFYVPAQLWKFNAQEDRLENKLFGTKWQYGINKLNRNNFPDNEMEGFVEFDVNIIGKQFLGLKGNFSFSAPVILEDPDNLVNSKHHPSLNLIIVKDLLPLYTKSLSTKI